MNKGDNVILINKETGKNIEGEVVREDEYGLLVLVNQQGKEKYALIPSDCEFLKVEQKLY